MQLFVLGIVVEWEKIFSCFYLVTILVYLTKIFEIWHDIKRERGTNIVGYLAAGLFMLMDVEV